MDLEADNSRNNGLTVNQQVKLEALSKMPSVRPWNNSQPIHEPESHIHNK